MLMRLLRERTTKTFLFLLLGLLLLPSSSYAANHLQLGHKHLRSGQFAQALQHYLTAQKSWGHTPQIAWYLGHAYFAQGAYKKAAAAYKESLKGLPASLRPKALTNLGNTYYKRKKWGIALQMYAKALRLDPQCETARFNLELTLRKMQSPPPPPPPQKKQQKRPPPPRLKKSPPRKRAKKKHQQLGPPKDRTLKLPELRRIRLKTFDRFIPYSRLHKPKPQTR